MKRPRTQKAYPNWRQRDTRHVIWSIVVGGIAATITGLLIYLANHGRGI